MDLLLSLIAKHVLKTDPSKVTKNLASSAVHQRMQAAIPDIVAGMKAKGFTTPPHLTPVPVIRDALFRLWRVVVPSGTVADAIRDAQDDQVVAAVQPKVTPTTTLDQVVTLTMKETIEVTF